MDKTADGLNVLLEGVFLYHMFKWRLAFNMYFMHFRKREKRIAAREAEAAKSLKLHLLFDWTKTSGS